MNVPADLETPPTFTHRPMKNVESGAVASEFSSSLMVNPEPSIIVKSEVVEAPGGFEDFDQGAETSEDPAISDFLLPGSEEYPGSPFMLTEVVPSGISSYVKCTICDEVAPPDQEGLQVHLRTHLAGEWAGGLCLTVP